MCIATDHDPQAICPLKTARAQDTRSHPYCVNIVLLWRRREVLLCFLFWMREEGLFWVFFWEREEGEFFFSVFVFFRVCFFLVLFFLFFLDLLYIFRVFGVCCSFLLSFCSGGVLVVFVVCEFFSVFWERRRGEMFFLFWSVFFFVLFFVFFGDIFWFLFIFRFGSFFARLKCTVSFVVWDNEKE